MKLTVSYENEEVEISFDREGLDRLVRSLTAMQGWKAPDHDHLFTEDWGGSDLTTTDAHLATVAHHLRLELVGAEGGRDEVQSRSPVPREPT
jgi:hypothetical protein